MKNMGKYLCTLLLTAALVFTFAPWTGAVNEAHAAGNTIQSVNINCDIPAIGLKKYQDGHSRTEEQVHQIIGDHSSCTTVGVHAMGSTGLSFWDDDGQRFLSVTSRDKSVDPSVQYYLSQNLSVNSGYDWPENVKQATEWTKVSSLAGFTITLNGVNCDDAVISYVEAGGSKWLDVNVPIGNDISKATVVVYPNQADYSGSPREPAWFIVKLPDGDELSDGQYNVSYIDPSGRTVSKPVLPGAYKVKITAKGIYSGTAWGAYTIMPMDITDGGTAKLTTTKYTYNGKPRTPGAVVTRGGKTLAAGTDYTISYKNNKNAGTATAVITGTGLYGYGWEFSFVITKAGNPLKVAPKTATVKYSKLKKKAQTLKVSKVIRFTKKGQGALSYKLLAAKKGQKSFKKYFYVAPKTGKVTVRKGLKKGTYKVKVNVKAKGNANYKASKPKPVTFKVRVK